MFRAVLSITIVAVMSAGILIPTPSASAQTGSQVFTYTEAEVNQALANDPTDRLAGTVVDLQPNAVFITGGYTTQNGGSYTISAMLVPQYVDDSFAGWAISELSVTGATSTGDAIDNTLTNLLMGTWRAWENTTFSPRNDIVTVVITDNDITYTLAEPLESDNGFDVNAQDGTLTITEAELNATIATATSSRSGQFVSDTYIDLQPGQVVISATFNTARDDFGPYYVAATFAPTVNADGTIDWTLTAFVGPDLNNGQQSSTGNAIERAWSGQWDRTVSENYGITAITITDTTLTYSVEAR